MKDGICSVCAHSDELHRKWFCQVCKAYCVEPGKIPNMVEAKPGYYDFVEGLFSLAGLQ